jgi:hypothetical protein
VSTSTTAKEKSYLCEYHHKRSSCKDECVGSSICEQDLKSYVCKQCGDAGGREEQFQGLPGHCGLVLAIQEEDLYLSLVTGRLCESDCLSVSLPPLCVLYCQCFMTAI